MYAVGLFVNDVIVSRFPRPLASSETAIHISKGLSSIMMLFLWHQLPSGLLFTHKSSYAMLART
jgi:hypothetical protein